MQASIKGTTLPVLEVSLGPGESVISTHGELSWMTPNIVLSQTTGGGGFSAGGLFAAAKRALGGGSFFQTQYLSRGGPGLVAFATKLPGQILPVQITPGNGMMVHRHGFLCGTPGITATAAVQQSIRAGLWGGEGFILQRIEGTGEAWIELSGEVVTYNLGPGQQLLVHPGHVGLFQESVSFQITRLQGIRNLAFGDDGFHLVSLTGPGEVWLQSMPVALLAQSLAPYLPQPQQR